MGLVRKLARSPEPAIQWRVRVRALEEDRDSARIRELERRVRASALAQRLLAHRFAPYRSGTNHSIYHYWQGFHWALASVADIGYPPRDPDLAPILDQALSLWVHPRYEQSVVVRDGTRKTSHRGVSVIDGRYRRCASEQGNALWYATNLGYAEDERVARLAELLLRWQWPDGGWNCDRRPAADTSSFMETLSPMRGLAALAGHSGSTELRRASERAAEVFLERRLYRRRSDGRVIRPDFVRLHYPLYWHYDVLGGLKGLAEAGRIHDSRCADALDWLEEQELPGGGWPAHARYFRVSSRFETGAEYVDWGGSDRRLSNPWVTTDALFVLRAAGRLAG